MEESEFSIHLFSNSSLQNYPDNSLTRFSVDLATPLYLGVNRYKVALSEIFVPPGFPIENTLSSRDCIIYEDVNYEGNDFAAFIDTTLRLCTMDVTIYDRSYFRHYLDPSVVFHPHTLHLTHPDDVTAFADGETKKYFKLDIIDLVTGIVSEAPSDYIPSVRSAEFVEYFKNSSVTVALRRRYTLKQLLWTCIDKILSKTRMESYVKPPANNPLFGELKLKYPKKDDYEARLLFVRSKSHTLMRRFIERFVSAVETTRLAIMTERSLQAARLEKYLIVYCDICSDRLFSGTRAKILSLFDYDAKRDFSVKLSQLDYSRVDRAVVHTISILLMDEYGEQLNLQESMVPTHVCLKLKRI